ncbi:MAG: anaerobic sulfatase maturase [Gammaproteobacteria bacterium]|nr:anaerobic sulfatase maturase [Gammaproteobacteria bacterium]
MRPPTDQAPTARAPFHLLIKPIGAKCNLRCNYCYYLDKDKLYPDQHSFRMSDETLKSLTQQYINAQPQGTAEVNFAWQGGEPTLLNLEFFRQAIHYQRQFSRPGLSITNALQTNGTLLDDDWGEFLKDHQFLVGISVDGPMKLHDSLRKTKSGDGSFNLVKRGIEVLRRHQVEHNFLCTVNKNNAAHPKKVYAALKNLGAEHIQFIPIVEHEATGSHLQSSHTINAMELSVDAKQYGKFLNVIFDIWHEQDIGQVFIQNFERVLSKILRNVSTVCTQASTCGRNLVIEHDGSIFSCDHFVYPEYEQGNLQNTDLIEIVDNQNQLEFGLAKKNKLCDSCKKCSFLEFCHGDCPALRISKVKQEKHRLNYLCAGNKLFFQHSGPKMMQLARSLSGQQPRMPPVQPG